MGFSRGGEEVGVVAPLSGCGNSIALLPSAQRVSPHRVPGSLRVLAPEQTLWKKGLGRSGFYKPEAPAYPHALLPVYEGDRDGRERVPVWNARRCAASELVFRALMLPTTRVPHPAGFFFD